MILLTKVCFGVLFIKCVVCLTIFSYSIAITGALDTRDAVCLICAHEQNLKLYDQSILMLCYGVSSCFSEDGPPCCFCFLSLTFPSCPFKRGLPLDVGDYRPGAILIMATPSDPYFKNQLVWMMY